MKPTQIYKNKGYIDFETQKHHKQILRQQIKPELINKLEISQNPSLNYKYAYQSVYKDQLEKSIEDYTMRKMQKSRINGNISQGNLIKVAQMNLASQTLPVVLIGNTDGNCNDGINTTINSPMKNSHLNNQPQLSPQQSQNLNSSNISTRNNPYHRTFRDYFQQRNDKIDTLINYNYDGGDSFFKIQDTYRLKKKQQQQQTLQFIKRQLQTKDLIKQSLKQKQNLHSQAIKQMQHNKDMIQKQQLMRSYSQKQEILAKKVIQAEEQKIRRQRKSKQFRYNKMVNHNPITNPIEYHIDNPYILKKIQDRSFG